jgi:eukaryotic-like serine/threonine-protein kinase
MGWPPSHRLPTEAETPRREQALELLGRAVAGRWIPIELLGIGGTASVYRARHRNGNIAALKVLHHDIACRPASRRRFLSEGYAANRVGHPGAVRVLDDGEDEDTVFLVMELLDGQSLAQRLDREGPLPAGDVVGIGAAVLDVLGAAHQRGIVHRDIKPSNLFQLASGEIKVLDFGVAQVRDGESAAVTQSGAVLGTPAFMAPEQAAGRHHEVDALSDLWAVGATMFQLLTGRLVHEAASPNAAIVAAATTPARSVRALRPDVPEDIAAVVDRALAFHREERWPSAPAMRGRLPAPGSGPDAASYQASFGPATTLPEEPSGISAAGLLPVAARWRRLGPALGALGAVVLLGAGAMMAPRLLAARAPLAPPKAARPQPVAPPLATGAPAIADAEPSTTSAPTPDWTAPANVASPTAKKGSAKAAGRPRSHDPRAFDETLIETRH